jgi:plasmid maintenance system antidote protein VapI
MAKVNKRRPAQEASPLIGVLRDAIRDSGLSLREISKKTGVGDPQLSRFVRGERTLTLPAAEKLVEFFGLRLVKPGQAGKN